MSLGIQLIAHHKAPEREIRSISGISEMKSGNISIAEQNHKAKTVRNISFRFQLHKAILSMA